MRLCLLPLVVLTLMLAPNGARADGGIDADRPDFTNGPRALETGRWQLEAGATRTTQSGASAWTVGEGLVRHGIAPGLELRLALPTWNRSGDGPEASRGLGDGGAGFKCTLPGATDALAFGAIGDVTLPTGARGVGAGVPGGDLVLAVDRALTSRLDVTCNAGASRQAGATALLVSTSWGLDLGHGLGSWAEWAAAATAHATADRFDGGFTLAVGPNVQLDVRAGEGAGDARGEATLGAGVTTRW